MGHLQDHPLYTPIHQSSLKFSRPREDRYKIRDLERQVHLSHRLRPGNRVVAAIPSGKTAPKEKTFSRRGRSAISAVALTDHVSISFTPVPFFFNTITKASRPIVPRDSNFAFHNSVSRYVRDILRAFSAARGHSLGQGSARNYGRFPRGRGTPLDTHGRWKAAAGRYSEYEKFIDVLDAPGGRNRGLVIIQ